LTRKLLHKIACDGIPDKNRLLTCDSDEFSGTGRVRGDRRASKNEHDVADAMDGLPLDKLQSLLILLFV